MKCLGRLTSSLVLPLGILLCIAGADETAKATLVGAGDIAFIRFNADNPDDLAIVLLADADAGQKVHFNSNLYSPTFNLFASSVPSFTWQIDTALSAGTVVTFTGLDVPGGGTVSLGHGSMIKSASGPTGQAMPLLEAGDTVYAFFGTDRQHPTTFLAAITTESSSRITDAGLTVGSTGILLPSQADEAHYNGPRDSSDAFADYLSLIGNVGANWQVRTADTGTLNPTFDATNFTLTNGEMVPESPRMILLGVVFALLMLAWNRKRLVLSAHPQPSNTA